MGKQWNIAVAGATSAVGGQIIECLAERKFPVGRVRFLDDSRSAGEILELKRKPVLVEELAQDSFAGIDIAFFATGDDLSREFSPLAVRAGAVVVDISGAWRPDPLVPLVVPGVNPHAVAGYTAKGIVACPGSSSIQLATALKPLYDAVGIRRVVLSAYESVSGNGNRAIEELRAQTIDLMSGRPTKRKVYPHRIAFNCLPQSDAFGANGYTGEEMQLAGDIGRVFEADIRVTATVVRVPVFYGNCAAVNIETGKKIAVAQARELIAGAPGCKLVDDVAKSIYPLPSDAAGQNLVHVGRIREDESIANGLNLWIAADNIRNAAAGAVGVAEILIEKHL
ncbi:MAG TPA: aspartate-semialdehyde dehydrogenase [Geobacteraceae bacterium]